MTTLFLNARLIDPEAGSDASGSLLVQHGRILARSDQSDKAAFLAAHNLNTADVQIVDCHGKCLAPGIVDIGVKVCEPGERHKESYKSAGLAAAAGGVTTIVTRPDTTPCIDSPETLEFVTRRAQADAPVNVLPMAALTKGREGREMTEIGFLLDAGAVAFTDCDHVVTSTKVFSRALTYARSCGALVIAHPQEPGLSQGAAATEQRIEEARVGAGRD